MSNPLPLDVAAVRRALAGLEARVQTVVAGLPPPVRRGGAVIDAVEQIAADVRRLREAAESGESAACRRRLEDLERALRGARQAALDEQASDIVGLALTDLHADVRALLMETEPDDAARLDTGASGVASHTKRERA